MDGYMFSSSQMKTHLLNMNEYFSFADYTMKKVSEWITELAFYFEPANHSTQC